MIIGINLHSINAKTERRAVRELKINSTPKILSVGKKDVLDMKDVLVVKFSFETTYEPVIGHITMEGEVLYKSADTKKILKKWEDEKKIDKKIAVVILNAIFKKCIAKAIELAEELRLPPPIRFPVVKAV